MELVKDILHVKDILPVKGILIKENLQVVVDTEVNFKAYQEFTRV